MKIDASCKQCSGNANFINKAFKVACLTYNSSKVKYSDELYERAELMERQRDLMIIGDRPLDNRELLTGHILESSNLNKNAAINDSCGTLLEDRRSESPYPDVQLASMN